MGHGSQASEIDNFDRRIRRTFQVHRLAPLSDCRFDRLVIARITERYLNAESRQEFDKQLVRPPVGVLNGNDAIAGRQEGKKRVADRAHAARKTGGGFGRFQIPYLLFEGGYGGICVPAIDMARRLSLRHREPLVHIVVAEGDAKSHRDLRGALPIFAFLTSPHSPGSKSRVICVFVLVASAHSREPPCR